MNCKRVQRELSVRPAGESRSHNAIARHLQECAACSAFREQMEKLETSIAGWPCDAPPPDLERRIAEALDAPASATPVSSRPSRSPWRLQGEWTIMRWVSWGGAALAAGLILTASLQTGRANTLRKRMGQASRGVQSVHLVGWNCELLPEVERSVQRGQTVHSVTEAFPRRYEAWIQGGRWRESQESWGGTQGHVITLYHAGRVWKNGDLEPGEKRPPRLATFALRAIMGEEPFGPRTSYTTKVLGEAVQDGRPTVQLQVETMESTTPDGNEGERRIFWLDPKSYLPIRMTEMRRDSGRWVTDAILWFDYDTPVPGALFDPLRVRSEQGAPITSARDYYRMTGAQEAEYHRVLADFRARQDRINADPSLTHEQRDRQLVREGAAMQERVARMMTPNQRRLWIDWNEAQAEMQKKLQTPEQLREEAAWWREQQRLLDAWLRSQQSAPGPLFKGRSEP